MRKAVITGVGPDGGLGAQLCKRFATEGLHVLVAGRTKTSVDAVADSIRRAGGRPTAVVADATDERQVVSLFDQAGDDIDVATYSRQRHVRPHPRDDGAISRA